MPILLPILLFAAAAPYDLLIRNGHVIDGTGSPWYAADIGIRAGKIAGIGRLADAPAKRTIDARGMVVAPGFIDMLGQSEMTILVNPQLPSKIFQGITTEGVEHRAAERRHPDAVERGRPYYRRAQRSLARFTQT
jgi:N-acyl-D-amino-acid deacylase